MKLHPATVNIMKGKSNGFPLRIIAIEMKVSAQEIRQSQEKPSRAKGSSLVQTGPISNPLNLNSIYQAGR
ncbi:MAG: hypothetical protein HPY61_14045 [Methanotrichaceae archaeon]|nr:hypothetical protein [Methanotrichaceae archaeon]